MNALKLSLASCLAALLTIGSVGCSSNSSSNNDGGTGGATSGGSGGASSGTGGSGAGGSATGAGGHADAGSDVRADGGGAGGMIIIVDAAGNTFTCADLMTCCNSTTNTTLKAACLNEYATVSPMGNAACGTVLVEIKANGQCL